MISTIEIALWNRRKPFGFIPIDYIKIWDLKNEYDNSIAICLFSEDFISRYLC
ncbi:MAG: hypothetical protein ACUVWN_10785 [bacterium]